MPTFNDATPAYNPTLILPLFVEDMETMKARLRLSGLVSPDAMEMIRNAVQRVRIGFYSHLAEYRIGVLVSYSSVMNPTTASQISRTLAETTEVMWTRWILLQELPTMFVDGNSAQAAWNEDGLSRDGKGDIDRLWGQIEENLIVLSADSTKTLYNRITVIEPLLAAPRPGQSIGNTWRRPNESL